MVAVPAATAVMMPEVPIETIPVALLLQVPPPVVADKVPVPPTQMLLLPLIVPGPGFTETVLVAEHPAK